jgi:hypothetical protein
MSGITNIERPDPKGLTDCGDLEDRAHTGPKVLKALWRGITSQIVEIPRKYITVCFLSLSAKAGLCLQSHRLRSAVHDCRLWSRRS